MYLYPFSEIQGHSVFTHKKCSPDKLLRTLPFDKQARNKMTDPEGYKTPYIFLNKHCIEIIIHCNGKIPKSTGIGKQPLSRDIGGCIRGPDGKYGAIVLSKGTHSSLSLYGPEYK